MIHIIKFCKNIPKTCKRLGRYLYNRIIHKNSEIYLNSFFEKYRDKLREKIDYILEHDETSVSLSSEDQEEQALPGFKKHLETGYYKYMLSRYLYSIDYIRGKQVLDSGCGLGWGSYLIIDFPREILSIETNAKALNFAKEKWKDRRLNFDNHSVLDIDSLNKQFDVILGFELIEHLTFNEGKTYLKQAFNNLSKKGVLILSSSFPDSEEQARLQQKKNKYHLQVFTKSELKNLAKEAGFRKVKFIGNCVVVARK